MALFSSVFIELLEYFVHLRETPQRAQQCAAQELPAGYRKAGEKKKKERKRKGRKITGPMPLLVEVKPLHSTARSSFLKPMEGELPSVSGHLALPGTHFKPLPPVSKPVPASEDVLSQPCSPLQVDPPKLSAAPSCPDEVVSFRHSSSQMHPLAVPPRPTPASNERFSIRRSSSQVHPAKPQMVPLAVPPRPTPASNERFSIRRSSSQVHPAKPQMVPPRPTPAPDELFSIRGSSSQVRPPKGLPPSPTPAPDEVVALRRPPSRKPQPVTSSLLEPPPQLKLVDIEEENEYVEYTGKTIRASDLLKSERSQMPEAEMNPRKRFAWLEKDSEVLEEAWAGEVEEIQGFEEEKGDPSEMGDSKAMRGLSDEASQVDEHMRRLFCVTSPYGPMNEIQHEVNVQKKCKRKVPFFLFTWAEEKTKKQKEKKITKEKERRERELLLERYKNDPKLKHLWINKHNRNYNS